MAGGLAKCAVQQRRFDSGLMGFGLASAAATLRPGGWPLDPALESLSWTVILQGALVLGIWSTSRGAAGQRANRTAQVQGKAQAMLAAFFFGCIGSLAGSFLGVQVAGCFAQTAADRQVWPIAASCLAASYIGGTANFFETAAALGAKSSPSTLKALNLIAGIDILVMVAYFGVLLWLRSQVMQGRGPPFLRITSSSSSSFASISGDYAAPASLSTLAQGQGPTAPAWASTVLACVLAALSTALQQACRGLPGVSVVASVGAAVAVSKASHAAPFLASPAELSRSNERLMAAFYVLIGLNCRAQDVLAVGPAVVILVVATLVVHLASVLGGSWAYNKFYASRGRGATAEGQGGAIDVDTAVIASNACVGGSSTAASMAAAFSGADASLPFLGSAAGVIGYLVGTPLALALARSIGAGLPRAPPF